MRILLSAGALIALGIAAVSIPEKPLSACAMAPLRADTGVQIASESALIVFDRITKTQHFLRTANFDTSSSEFGFFVPTPTQPELAEASSDIFPALAKLTAPRIIERTATITEFPSFGCFMKSSKTFAVGEAMPMAGQAVRVIETKRIGAFDAAVLQATNAKALQDWLNDNQYATRPALEQWFDVYIQKGWYLVAFKIAVGEVKKTSNAAVRISFKTDVPIYPYREPLDAKEFAGPQSNRLLRLFVIADQRVTGKLGNAEWAAGKTVWSKPIAESALAPILAAGKMPELKGTYAVTELEDRSSPRLGIDDIAFTPSADQSEMERSDVIRTNYVYAQWPQQMACIVIGSMPFLLPIAGLLIWNRMRRKRTRAV